MMKRLMVLAFIATSFSGLARGDREKRREEMKSMTQEERQAFRAERQARREERYSNASDEDKALMDEHKAKREARRAAQN